MAVVSLMFRFCLLALFATCAGLATASSASAETRSLKLYYIHTKEKAEIVFKRNGRYDQAGLTKLNRFLRDWRRNEPTKMDPKLFDLVWEVYKQTGARDYIHVVSAYRSPATNDMLRRTRGGQAKKSQHTMGTAMDFFIPGVKLATLRATAMKIQGGGVGYYPKSGSPFIHLDTGSVRAWPRMSRQELSQIFPDGKTIHLPPDGKPLPGYNVALAEYKKRGGAIVSTGGGDSKSSGKRSGGLLAALFGGDEDESPDEIIAAPAPAPAPPRVEVASMPSVADAPQAAAPAAVNGFVLPTRGPVPDARPVLEAPVVVAALAPPQPVLPAQAEVNAFAAAASAEVAVAPPASVPVNLASIRAPIPVLLAERAAGAGPAPAQAPEAQAVEVAALPVPTPIRSRMLAEASEADVEIKTASASANPVPLPSPAPAPVETAAVSAPDGDFVPLPIRRPADLAVDGPAAPAPVQAGDQAPGQVEVASLGLAPRGQRLATVSANASAPRKGARPTAAQVADLAPRPAVRTEPKLTNTMISKWALAQERVQTMSPSPDKSRQFVVTQLRAAPKVVYANGFAPGGGDLPHNQFTGSAVNFVTVARFGE